MFSTKMRLFYSRYNRLEELIGRGIWLLVCLFLISRDSLAIRQLPRYIPPVDDDGVRYSLSYERDLVRFQVYLTATSLSDRKEKWRTLAYWILYNPFRDKDVQEIYPRELKVSRELVTIVDERDRKYSFSKLVGQVR